MIKDIVVNLSVRTRATGSFAISLAGTLDAHVTGIAIAHDPTVPESGMGYLPVELVDQRRDNEATAKDVTEQFAAAATRAGVSAETRTLSASVAGAVEQFGRIARRFDLAIVGQTDPEVSAVEATLPVSTLIASGRPVIIVPCIQRAPLKLDHVMVCWDGSRPAARATADALPLLERAGRVEVIMIKEKHSNEDEIEADEMGLHLARHGLKVDVTHLVRGDFDIADALLSHAADVGADFIVMGAYGHSRLREVVLGGVTRSILRSMAVPTLMSH